MISLPAGTRIWLAAGVTDMRCGFQGLCAKVQTALEENPLGGNVFIFRGRRGDLVKILWATEDGLWLQSGMPITTTPPRKVRRVMLTRVKSAI